MRESPNYGLSAARRLTAEALPGLSLRPVLARPAASVLGGIAIAATIIAFALVWGLPYVITPLSTDEAYYALGGRTVLDGKQLYTDFWDVKPPLVYLVYVLPLSLLGDDPLSIRVFHLAVSAVAVGAVFLLTRRFFSQRAALIGAGIYAFSFFALADFVALGEAESFMAVPLCLAFAVYRPRDDAQAVWLASVSAGLLLGAVVALKFSAFVFVFGLPAAELLFRTNGEWSWSGAAKRLIAAAMGFLAVQALWVGYLVNAGAWSAFIDIQVNYTIPYNKFRWAYEEAYGRALVRSSAEWLRGAAYLTVPAWAALLLSPLRGNRPAVHLLSILALLGLVSVWWQGKLFHYHWLIMLPFLAALAGSACDSLLELVRPIGRRAQVQLAVVLLAGFVILGFGTLLHAYDTYGILIDRATGRISQAEVEDRYGSHFHLVRELTEAVSATPADESYLIWGIWTAPYLEADRPFPTRFIANHGVRAEWAPEAWRQELLSDLHASRPRFIVVAAGDNMPWLTGADEASDQYICYMFPQLRLLIENEYKAVLNNGLFVVYDRDATQHSALPRCDI